MDRRPFDLSTAHLRPWQRAFLEGLGRSNLADSCYLTGGTALAGFYLGHRDSEDLDLFSEDEIPMGAIEIFLDDVAGGVRRDYHKLYDRKIFLFEMDGAPAKVEFTRFPFPPCAERHRLATGLAVDALVDIYLNKLHAMAERIEPKDDIDLYFLLERCPVPPIAEAARLAEEKFGTRGLRYALQPRLLREPEDLPATRPSVRVEDVAACLRAAARELARTSLEG